MRYTLTCDDSCQVFCRHLEILLGDCWPSGTCHNQLDTKHVDLMPADQSTVILLRQRCWMRR